MSSQETEEEEAMVSPVVVELLLCSVCLLPPSNIQAAFRRTPRYIQAPKEAKEAKKSGWNEATSNRGKRSASRAEVGDTEKAAEHTARQTQAEEQRSSTVLGPQRCANDSDVRTMADNRIPAIRLAAQLQDRWCLHEGHDDKEEEEENDDDDDDPEEEGGSGEEEAEGGKGAQVVAEVIATRMQKKTPRNCKHQKTLDWFALPRKSRTWKGYKNWWSVFARNP